jgi:hypothetical protein
MINILQDGFSNFQNHFWIILCVFLAIVWGQTVMQKIFSKVFDNQFNADEYFVLSLSGWIFPVFCWAGIYFLANILLGESFASIISILIIVIPFFFIRIKRISLVIFYLLLFLLISLFLRLAFLEQAIFPAYFDSAEHYRNIQNIVNIYENKSSSLFQYNYYHLGYHFVSASLIDLFQFNKISFMLIFGQMILTILPISFFFLLKQITQSNTVAFFTCLIAGFGFHMPAHLINWGKYPALLSLVGIQFLFCLGYILVKYNLTRNQKSKLYGLIVLSILITALIHTRTLIVFIVFVISFFITSQIKKTPSRFQYFSFTLLFIFIAIEVFYITNSPVIFPLLSGYTERDLWALVFVLLLIPFSIKFFPNLIFFLLTTLCLSMFFLFLPISLFNYGTQTLLDRPFVQMLAYIPLSIIAGLGFAGLIQITQKFRHAKFVIGFILFGFVVFNAKINYDFYPSDCCQLVSRDDLSAISWIDNNIPANEKILIAATQIYVTSYEPTGPAAVDAGIWIQPLTNNITQFAFINTNFEEQETLAYLCEKKIKYIYIGSTPQSFNEIQIASKPNWYHPIFLLPKVKIYQVIGCD